MVTFVFIDEFISKTILKVKNIKLIIIVNNVPRVSKQPKCRSCPILWCSINLMYFLVSFHISLSSAHHITHSPIISASCLRRQSVGTCSLVTQFPGADSGLFILKPGRNICVYVDIPLEPDCLWNSSSSGKGGAWIPYTLCLPSTFKLSWVSWLTSKNQTDSRNCPTGLQITFNILPWPSTFLLWEPFMN